MNAIILLIMKMYERKSTKVIKSYSEIESIVASDDSCHLQSKPFDQKLEQLMQTLSRMKIFISKLKEYQIQVQHNIVYNFCDLYQKQLLSPENVVPLLDKRIERMMKNRRLKKNWSLEDLDILVWTVNNFAALHKIEKVQNLTEQHWKSVADLIPGTTGDSCMFKILSLRKVRLSEQNWNQDQSNLLFDIVKDSQKVDWKLASQQLFKRNKRESKIFRNAKQCKQHWSCYLNPNLKKGPWSIGEDIILIQYIIENSGRKKWTQISKFFEGRTQNALKNRYNLLVDRYRQAGDNQKSRYQLKMLQGILEDLLLRKGKAKLPTDNYKPYNQETKKKAVCLSPSYQPKSNRNELVRPCKQLKQAILETKENLQKCCEAIKQETIILVDGNSSKSQTKIDLIEVPQAHPQIKGNVNLAMKGKVQACQDEQMYSVFFDGFIFWMILNQKFQ